MPVVRLLRFSENIPRLSCQAITKPAVTKPRFDQVFAGCLIKPGLKASQNSPAPPPQWATPNQPLTKAVKNMAIEIIVTQIVMRNTHFLDACSVIIFCYPGVIISTFCYLTREQ